MKTRVALRTMFAAVSLAALSGIASAAPPAGFEQRVEQLRKDIGVPGVSIAIVEDGKVTLAHGWGVRDITTNKPVDADTIFFTGSTGKAFTNAALATLVDEGKIGWDDKVIDHMPDFRMWDPWVTREMTIRDLLVHRSGLGLGQGDLLFLPNSTLVAQGNGAAHPLPQARDQFPQRLCLRQYPLHGGWPADRGSQRQDVGAVHPRPCLRPARDEELDRHRQGIPGKSQSCAPAQPQRRPSSWNGNAGSAR